MHFEIQPGLLWFRPLDFPGSCPGGILMPVFCKLFLYRLVLNSLASRESRTNARLWHLKRQPVTSYHVVISTRNFQFT
jgi:hypothetical protein